MSNPSPLLVLFIALFVGRAMASEPDTLWFGGFDPSSGLAVQGGIWDFDGA
jgi:hypothetical protein